MSTRFLYFVQKKDTGANMVFSVMLGLNNLHSNYISLNVRSYSDWKNGSKSWSKQIDF